MFIKIVGFLSRSLSSWF